MRWTRWIVAGCCLVLAGCLVAPPDFSADGRYLAYGVRDTPDPDLDLRTSSVQILDVSNNVLHDVPLARRVSGYWPSWANGSNTLAILQRDSRWGIALYRPRLRSLRTLYRAPENAVLGAHIAWSLDDRYIYANQKTDTEPYRLLRIDTDTGEALALDYGLFGWPVDATRVLWLRVRANDYAIHPGRTAQLMYGEHVLDLIDGGVPHYPSLSPDRRHFAYYDIVDNGRPGEFEAGVDALRLRVAPWGHPQEAVTVDVTLPEDDQWWYALWDGQGNALTFLAFRPHNDNRYRVLGYSVREGTVEELQGGAAALVFDPYNRLKAFTVLDDPRGPRTALVRGVDRRWLP